MSLPVPHHVIDGRALRLSLGLRPLHLDDWLTVDDDYTAEMAEKARLLAARPDDVVAHLPAGLDAAAETLGLVRAWMSARYPECRPPVPPGLHPVDEAGRLVQEDLCVLTRLDDQWALTAASVCFPSRWRLADKIGTSVGAIHDPVPGYHDTIGPIVDRSLDRLHTDRPLWRLNWTILDDPALFQPAGDHSGREGAVDPNDLTFRVERQTLRRLPTSGGILFTIRTYRYGLPAVVSRPELAANLATTLRTCSPEMAQYKGWTTMLPALITHLGAAARHTGSAAP